MSNLKPASSIIPHAPGLAISPNKPIATPGIAHAPGLVRPADRMPPPVHHAPGMPQMSPAEHAKALLDAAHAAVPPPVVHAPPLADRPVNPMQVSAMRSVPKTDFDAIKARKIDGVDTKLGFLAPPRPSTPIDDPGQLVVPHRQMTGLQPNQRSNSVTFDPTIAGGQTFPFLQFDGTVDETDMLTIMLGGPKVLTGGQLIAGATLGSTWGVVQALVTWGVGNATFSALFDWKQGTCISLPANFLSVTAVVGDGGGVLAGNGITMKLDAAVAYGAVPSRPNRATTTVITQTASIGGGASLSPTIAIPNFAVALGVNVGTLDSVTPVPGSVGNLTDFGVEFLGPGGVTTGPHWDYRYADNSNVGQQTSQTYPIPNGARYVRFGTPTGSSTNATLKVTCLFDLSF